MLDKLIISYVIVNVTKVHSYFHFPRLIMEKDSILVIQKWVPMSISKKLFLLYSLQNTFFTYLILSSI